MHHQNIEAMYRAVEEGLGFDVIIVVSSTRDQADFWQDRLPNCRGTVIGRKAQVISVEEDWPGGAGQLLGTLYAWEKARSKVDLNRILEGGGTVAIYHTAGRGMRMAPIPAAEANNKSAIKLPRVIDIAGKKTPITVLEAAIFQTGIFAASRAGRLGVFWGDQIFIPALPVDFEGKLHAEILDVRLKFKPDKESWAREWQSYGIIIPRPDGQALQREKQPWHKLQNLINKGTVKPDGSGEIVLGRSLGCFSISHQLLRALLEGSSKELAEKSIKLDTDPHLWMPLTSDHDEFVADGGDTANWKRVRRFQKKFHASRPEGEPALMFGDKDLGAGTLVCDYGQVRLYHQNFLRMLEDSFEGECLRQFFDLERHRVKTMHSGGLTVENSIILESEVRGRIKNSILVEVRADDLDVADSVIMNGSLAGVRGESAVMYNCIDPADVHLERNQVIADVFLPSHGRVRMTTDLSRDGKADWDKTIMDNPYSFDDLSCVVAGESPAGVAGERDRWIGYHRNRAAIQEFKHRFIKPATDNLVELVWGGDRIEHMKGLPPSGRKIGEAWECSVHHQHPSELLLPDGSSMPLDDLISVLGRDILGAPVAREFRGQLPILFKFLDAREDLSVQVHPSDEQAKQLGEKDTGKTEAWLVLDAEKDAVLYLGFKEDVDKSAFEKDLSSPTVNIAEKYLNAFPARAGDVFINPPGTVHAIGKGIVLAEIQQSSGITYRVWDWNRVPPRPLHIAQAMKSLNFRRTTRADFALAPRKTAEHEERLIDDFHFSVDRLTLASGNDLAAETKGSFQVLTCLKGRVKLEGGTAAEQLGQWESVLVPASLGHYRIIAQNDSVLLRSFVLTPEHIDPVIFQTYDVRAVADKYLFDRVCYYLGKGYGTFLRREQSWHPPETVPTVAVGGGIRLSTERIRRQVIRGIRSAGVNVLDVGVTSTPELYFSIPYLNADGGVNITASHNEAEYNGLKQVIRSEDGFITSINAEQMLRVKQIVQEGDFLEGSGEYVRIEDEETVPRHNELVKANCRLGRTLWIDLLGRWQDRGLKTLLETVSRLDFPESPDKRRWASIRKALGLPAGVEQPWTAIKYPLRGLRVVIDFGSGSAWRTEPLFSDLGAEVVALNNVPDGSFPAHIPDPIKARYRRQLEEAVIREAARTDKEVVGIGHDEDADRVIYVRSDGRVVEGDRTLAIQAKPIVKEHVQAGRPGRPRFMGEVKFSRVAQEYITASGGEYIMSPTGFAFIKDGIKAITRALRAGEPHIELFGRTIDLHQNREPVALAAELSGHQMSGHEENWIFDDALLASVKVLTVIAGGVREGKTFIDLDEAVPRYPATPELNIRLATNILTEKQEVVEAAISVFRRKVFAIDTTDGGLIQWVDRQGEWLGQALIRKSNTQPMIICRVEGRDEAAKQAIENEFFRELSRVSTTSVPKLDLASDDYIRGILSRVLG